MPLKKRVRVIKKVANIQVQRGFAGASAFLIPTSSGE